MASPMEIAMKEMGELIAAAASPQSAIDALIVEYANSLNARNGLNANAIINGNFDIAQRGTAFTNPATGAYTLDRWSAAYNSDGGVLPTSIVHSRFALASGILPGSYYFKRIDVNSAGSAFGVNAVYYDHQKIEHGTRLLCGDGKKVTVSFWARSNIANKKIGVYLTQGYGTGGAPTANDNLPGAAFVLNSSWTKYVYTIPTVTLVGKVFGTNNDDSLFLHLATMWGSTRGAPLGLGAAESFVGAGNIDIAQVQLCAGDVALPFQPRSFGEELALCQRYYEKSYDIGIAPGAVSAIGEVVGQASLAIPASTAGSLISPIQGTFKVRKRAIPTVTLYSRDGTVNAILAGGGTTRGGATASSPSESYPIGFISLSTASTVPIADRAQIQYQWTADAEL